MEKKLLSEEEILTNKEDFLNILIPVVERREGARTDKLVEMLENSDFFFAPASTKYHGNFKGGLCHHCLQVYYNMCKLVIDFGLEAVISRESVAIVALLHDFSKREYYDTYVANKKVYSEFGAKHDNMGKFDWVAEESYKVRDDDKRFIYGSHEETSEFMVRQLVPLSYEESCAILHHMGGLGEDTIAASTIARIYSHYPIATVLHLADMAATYITEES